MEWGETAATVGASAWGDSDATEAARDRGEDVGTERATAAPQWFLCGSYAAL